MFLKNTNFSEQAAWISVFFCLFIAGYYAMGLSHLTGTFATNPQEIVWLWIEVMVVSIVFVIIAFVLLAIYKKKHDADDEIGIIDERDEEIESKATTLAYFNINLCIMVLLIHVFSQAIFSGYPFFINVPAVDFLIHGLMFSGLLVEFILRATQIYRYRKAASLGESYE